MLVEQVEAALVMLAGAVSDPIYRFIAQISGLIEQVRYISTGLLRPYAQSVYIQGYGHNPSKRVWSWLDDEWTRQKLGWFRHEPYNVQ